MPVIFFGDKNVEISDNNGLIATVDVKQSQEAINAGIQSVLKPKSYIKPEVIEPIPSKTEPDDEPPTPPKTRKRAERKPEIEHVEGFSEEESQHVLKHKRGKARVRAYIKLILQKDGGECKRMTKDMAEQLGVSTSAFSASMRKLVREGFLIVSNTKYKRGLTGKTYKLAPEVTPEVLAETAKVFGVNSDKLIVANGRKVYEDINGRQFKLLGGLDVEQDK